MRETDKVQLCQDQNQDPYSTRPRKHGKTALANPEERKEAQEGSIRRNKRGRNTDLKDKTLIILLILARNKGIWKKA